MIKLHYSYSCCQTKHFVWRNEVDWIFFMFNHYLLAKTEGVEHRHVVVVGGKLRTEEDLPRLSQCSRSSDINADQKCCSSKEGRSEGGYYRTTERLKVALWRGRGHNERPQRRRQLTSDLQTGDLTIFVIQTSACLRRREKVVQALPGRRCYCRNAIIWCWGRISWPVTQWRCLKTTKRDI